MFFQIAVEFLRRKTLGELLPDFVERGQFSRCFRDADSRNSRHVCLPSAVLFIFNRFAAHLERTYTICFDRESQLQADVAGFRDQKRIMELHRFQRDGTFTVEFFASSKHHFNKQRTGRNDLVVHPVICQVWQG